MITKKEFIKKKKKYINQYKTAQKKVFSFVTKELGYKREGLKLKMAILILIDYLGLENINDNLNNWLLESYLSQDIEQLKKCNITFYNSLEWRNLRKLVLNSYQNKCMKCGSINCLHVDHILPRSKFKHLELDFNNMQILCIYCNTAKSNKDFTDYRNVKN